MLYLTSPEPRVASFHAGTSSKPQRAPGVWRSIPWSRCLSELLEPAHLGQLSCQQGALWDSRRSLGLHGPELLQELGFLCWLWSDCFHPDPGSPKRARVSWTREFWFISQPKRLQLVPLSSRANCPVCMCVCVSGRVCVFSKKKKKKSTLLKFCGVLLHLN